jgi:transcriptional regulator with XRE-family HTH domain
MARSTFGNKIRRLREKSGLGLRELAERVGISATYISVLERDQAKTPPSEDVVVKLARVLGCSQDELMALSGRISDDVKKVILKHPREVSRLLLAVKGMPPHEIDEISDGIEKRRLRKKRQA